MRLFLRTIFILLTLVGLSACFDTGVKQLGASVTDATTPVNNVDPFAVTLAFHDNTSTTNRLVQIQGNITLASANFSNVCGADGTACTCQFYISTSDTNPAATSSLSFSQQNNTLNCTIAGTGAPSSYNYVRILGTNGVISSGFLNIQSTLTLQDVLGSLSTTNVHKIFRYTCTRTFFEGEGVSAASVTCPANQRLGLIFATYTFYLYEGSTTADSNTSSRAGDTYYSTAFCGIPANTFLQTSCSTSPLVLDYGLYNTSAAPFTNGYTLTPGPGQASPTVGFAASPDNLGNCPLGLVQARKFVAQPASITAGSLATTPPNPPSGFINSSNGLNDTLVDPSSPAPANMIITRQPSQTPCDSTGSCSAATFGGTQTVQTVVYTPETPVVCVIPASLLTGI